MLQGGQGGVLVEPGNIGELTQALRAQYHSKEKVNIKVEYSYKRFNEKYSSRTMCQVYADIYDKLLFAR